MSWIFNKGTVIIAFERLKGVIVFRDKLLDTEKLGLSIKEIVKTANKYDIICIEKLNIKSMLKNGYKNTNKAILDVSWNQFANMLKYKVEETGKSIVFVNSMNTSKGCSKCGSIKEDLTLKDRVYCCDKCGFKIDRDLNASINILRLGLQSLRPKVAKSSVP